MKANRFWIVIVIFCLLLAGNPGTAQALPAAPIIFNITPNEVFNDLDATIQIHGLELNTVVKANLGGTELVITDVTEDGTYLTADVPWGMFPGLYDLSLFYTATDYVTSSGAVTVKSGHGQWLSNGPYGGDVIQILQHPTDYSTIYTVVANMGIFRTSDKGNNWESLFYTAGPIGNLAMDAVDTSLLYATRAGEGLYRSVDGGDTWSPIPIMDSIDNPMPIYTVRAFTNPAIGDVVYAALIYGNRDYECMDACGIYRSTDAGDTWERVSAAIPNDKKITSIAFLSDGSQLFAGTEDGQVYYGVSGGNNWLLASMDWNGATPPGHVSKLAVQPGSSPVNLFLISDGEGFSGPMFRCTPQGTYGLDCFQVDTGWPGANPVMDIKFKPGHPTDILISGYQPARSLDNGTSWHFYSDTSNPFQSSAVAYDGYPLNDSIFAGNQQGFYFCSSAGTQDTLEPTFKFIGTWEKQVQGITGLVPRYLEASTSDPLSVYVNTDGSGLFHTDDGGVNWDQLPNFVDDDGNQYTLRNPIAVDPDNDQHLMIATWQNTVKISTDGGQTWTESSPLNIPSEISALDPDLTSFFFSTIEPIPDQAGEYLAGGYFMDPDTGDYIAVPAGGLYHLEVSGTTATWTNLVANASLGRIQTIAFDPSDPLIVYAGTYLKDAGGYPRRAALVYSLNGGSTWMSWSPDESDEEFDVYQEIRTLTVHPTDGTLLSDGGSEILMLDPTGNAWNHFSSIPGNYGPINQLLFAPAGGGMPATLYAATMQGLYQSYDEGASWSYATSGLIGADVTVLGYARIAGNQDILYTGVAGGGLGSSAASIRLGSIPGTYTGLVGNELIDGGIYHLVRYTYFNFLPTLRK
jgi:hypothetical protein